MIELSKSEVAAALKRLQERGLRNEHFSRLHHRENVTLDMHLEYLGNTGYYRKQSQADIGRRILWLDRAEDGRDWHRLIDEVLTQYPMLRDV